MTTPLAARKKVIKVKVEAEKGTALAGDQALFVFDLNTNPTSEFIRRPGSGLYLGNKEPGVVAQQQGSCNFSTELRGTEAGGMEAGLAILLQACGFLQTAEVYTTSSIYTEHKTISIDVSQDGVKKILYGCMGEVEIVAEVGGRVMLNFEFSGVWSGVTDVALPAFAPSTAPPRFFTSGLFTYNTVAVPMSSFTLKMNNVVSPRKNPSDVGGIEHFLIMDNDPELSFDPETQLVATNDYFGNYQAGTPAAVAINIGTGTDDKFAFVLPAVQIKSLAGGDREGLAINDVVCQVNHSSGDDAITITVTDDNA